MIWCKKEVFRRFHRSPDGFPAVKSSLNWLICFRTCRWVFCWSGLILAGNVSCSYTLNASRFWIKCLPNASMQITNQVNNNFYIYFNILSCKTNIFNCVLTRWIHFWVRLNIKVLLLLFFVALLLWFCSTVVQLIFLSINSSQT